MDMLSTKKDAYEIYSTESLYPMNLPGHVDIPTCSRTGWVVTVPSTSRIFSLLDDRTAERRDDSDWVFIFLIALQTLKKKTSKIYEYISVPSTYSVKNSPRIFINWK